MEVWFHTQSYNSFGGHRTLSLIGSVLEMHPLAPAVDLAELELTACFLTLGSPRKTLEGAFERFHAELPYLPAVTFSPKKRKLAIRYRSGLGDARQILDNRVLSIELFLRGVHETRMAIHGLSSTLRKKKGLKLPQLMEWVDRAFAEAPQTQEALEHFQAWEAEERRKKIAGMSPWELLGLDWDDFHPAARGLLDDPFFWDTGNEYSPHGNDTGADLLEYLRDAASSLPSPSEFLDQLLRRWGMKTAVADALRTPFHELSEAGEIAITTYDESAIAIAFGFVKLFGTLPLEAAELGLQAICREREIAAARGWTLSDERNNSLKLLEEKILAISSA